MFQDAFALSSMQPESLKYVAEVARTGSLRLAAKRFDVAPSVVSRQIAKVERDLGSAIFERSPAGMVLTPAGRIVVDFLADSALRLDRMRDDVDDLTGLKRGTVRLAVVEALASDFMAQLLVDFGAAHPGIQYRIAVCGTHEIADRVVTGKADIGLAFNVLSREDLVLQGRIAQPLQLICRPDHPLASRGSVALASLDGVRAALPDRTFGIRYLIDQAAANAGIALSIAYEANSLAMLKAIVRTSEAVSFMPPLTFAHELETGVLRALELSDRASQQASIDIVTARTRSLASAARAFLKAILERAQRSKRVAAAPKTRAILIS